MTVSAPFHDQLVESIFGYTYFAMHFSPLVGQKLRFLQVRQLLGFTLDHFPGNLSRV